MRPYLIVGVQNINDDFDYMTESQQLTSTLDNITQFIAVIPEECYYSDFLNAAAILEGYDSFDDITDADDAAFVISMADRGFHEGDDNMLAEALSQMELVNMKKMYAKAGHDMSDVKHGKNSVSFIVTAPDGMRRKHTISGQKRSVENLGSGRDSQKERGAY